MRGIEIIGEASKNFSKEFKEKHKTIPWQDISNMRNKLIHNYPGVDYDIVWEVVQKDIDALGKTLVPMLEFKK